MSTESLVVELDAKTQKLDAALKSTDQKLAKLEGQTKKNDSAFTEFSASTKSAAGFLRNLGTTAVATAGAVVGLSKVVANYSKEIKIASEISGIGAEKLQVMAHATATVGIGIEKLGDISKDTREKVGDFLTTGGGGFMDFVDAMGLSKKEAVEVAKEFSKLSGPDILQKMVTTMEDAGLSAVQMSHALEGMASDTTNLIPLLRDGGEEMQRLSDNMASVVIPLSDSDINMFIRMGESVDLAGAAVKSLGEQVLVDLGDAFIEAANKAAHFYASLNEGTSANRMVRIADITDEIKTLEEGLENSKTASGRLWNALTFNTSGEKHALIKINELQEEKIRLQKVDADFVNKKLVYTDEGGDEGGEEKKITTFLDRKEELEKESEDKQKQRQIENIESRWLTEEEKLHKKYESELAIIGDHNVNKLKLEDDYLQALLALDDAKDIESKYAEDEQLLLESYERKLGLAGEDNEKQLEAHKEFLEAKKALDDNYAGTVVDDGKNLSDKKEKIVKSDIKDNEKATDAKIDNEAAYMNAATSIGQALFADNKAVSAGLAVANTATGITKALSTQNYAGAIATAVAGAAQLSVIMSSSKGGGGGGGGISAPSAPAPAQPDFKQDNAELDFTDSSVSGSSTNSITFNTETGDELVDAIANALNKGQKEGRF